MAPERRLTTRRLRLAGLDGVCGLLANGQYSLKTFGGKPEPVAALGRDG